jgi:hypothetical protein
MGEMLVELDFTPTNWYLSNSHHLSWNLLTLKFTTIDETIDRHIIEETDKLLIVFKESSCFVGLITKIIGWGQPFMYKYNLCEICRGWIFGLTPLLNLRPVPLKLIQKLPSAQTLNFICLLRLKWDKHLHCVNALVNKVGYFFTVSNA